VDIHYTLVFISQFNYRKQNYGEITLNTRSLQISTRK